MYGITDCVITDIDHTLKTGYAPCGSGEDYKLTAEELIQLRAIRSGAQTEFTREVFSRQIIIKELQEHALVQLKEKPLRVFVVGSFAKGGVHADSDIDILIEVKAKRMEAHELADRYRHRLRKHFIMNKIEGKADHLHPQYKGRRIDMYFTYNADQENGKIEIL